MKPARIMVVDDEPHIRRLLGAALGRVGYEVVETADAASLLSRLAIERPDVVLLDLGLPDRDGLELLPLIRRDSTARVLVVSAREATAEKVAALDLGADDFIGKPFDTEELLARVRVALRREAAADDGPLRLGEIEIDLLARRVRRGADEVHLTPKEYGLLAELAKHPGRVITHAQLLRQVWGAAHVNDVEYLRVAVRSLRAKLEADPAQPRLITNEPAVGYRLNA